MQDIRLSVSLALEETYELSILNLACPEVPKKLGKACRKLATARCVIKLLSGS